MLTNKIKDIELEVKKQNESYSEKSYRGKIIEVAIFYLLASFTIVFCLNFDFSSLFLDKNFIGPLICIGYLFARYNQSNKSIIFSLLFIFIHFFYAEFVPLISLILFFCTVSQDAWDYFYAAKMKEKTFLFNFQSIESTILCVFLALMIEFFKIKNINYIELVLCCLAFLLCILLNSKNIVRHFTHSFHKFYFIRFKKVYNFIAICILILGIIIFYNKLAAEVDLLIIVHVAVLGMFFAAFRADKLVRFERVAKMVCASTLWFLLIASN